MINIGWDNILSESKIINNGISKLRKISSKYDLCIITKYNFEQEKNAKIKYLNKHKLYNVIYVPYENKKNDVVLAKNSILVDDDLSNLDDWTKEDGISIFFNKNLENVDSYGNVNNKYKIIGDLNQLYDIIESI